MDLAARIVALKTTTFCGRRFTRQQIAEVAETASLPFSRNELAATICENLKWRTPNGRLKVNSAIDLLKKLEKLGICKAPAPRPRRTPVVKVTAAPELPPEHSMSCDLSEVMPLTLKMVDNPKDRKRFKDLMGHHYLGYKQPIGASLRYFVLDKNHRELGLLVFDAATWALQDRDEWIGWSPKHRTKRLHLIVCNSRFLILPHMEIPNLASKILSLVPKQLPNDWHQHYGYKPVLIETFVDQEKYRGTCYQAANWQHLGVTKGFGRFGRNNGKATQSVKDIYAYPLAENFRDVLLLKDAVAKIEREVSDQLSSAHDDILGFWGQVAPLIRSITAEFDQTWQINRRIIDTMLLVLLVYRLVASRGQGGYGTIIDGVWENCRKQGLPLPQQTPIAPSSFTAARRKMDPKVFKIINTRVIQAYEKQFERDDHLFFGHRIFAVDGSKVNLPPTLKSEGFKANQGNDHYPNGLISALFRLRLQIPVDFELTSDGNERKSALKHFAFLRQGDLVVYDRGYFSYAFYEAHISQNIHGVFRLSKSNLKPIVEFMKSGESERVISIELTNSKTKKETLEANPDIVLRPLEVRLIKYVINNESYFLATTLIGEAYPQESFKELYHERWGAEELYKVAKQELALEAFHAKTMHGVKQELYANFSMITLNRIFMNYTDDNPTKQPSSRNRNTKSYKTNFSNALSVMTRNIETLFLASGAILRDSTLALLDCLLRRRQIVRPNRSYPRISRRPTSRSQRFKPGKTKKVKHTENQIAA